MISDRPYAPPEDDRGRPGRAPPLRRNAVRPRDRPHLRTGPRRPSQTAHRHHRRIEQALRLYTQGAGHPARRQPRQLGSLLISGVVALGWGVARTTWAYPPAFRAPPGWMGSARRRVHSVASPRLKHPSSPSLRSRCLARHRLLNRRPSPVGVGPRSGTRGSGRAEECIGLGTSTAP